MGNEDKSGKEKQPIRSKPATKSGVILSEAKDLLLTFALRANGEVVKKGQTLNRPPPPTTIAPPATGNYTQT